MCPGQEFYGVMSKTQQKTFPQKKKDEKNRGKKKITGFMRSVLEVQVYTFLKVGNREEKEQSLAGQKSGQAKKKIV